MKLVLSTLALVALGSGVAAAADGALEINQDCALVGCFANDPAGFPVQITSGGTYVLTSDIVAGVTATALAINAPGASVSIDLQGHSIDGLGRCTGSPVTSCEASSMGIAVDVDALGAGSLLVRNGTLRGFHRGVFAPSLLGTLTLEALVVTEMTEANFAPIEIDGAQTNYVALRHVRLSRNFTSAMRTGSNTRVVLEHLLVTGNGNGGAGVHTLTIFGTGKLVDSSIVDNAALGLAALGTFALGRTAFSNNNGGDANAQYLVSSLRDMGGNVCGDGTCP